MLESTLRAASVDVPVRMRYHAAMQMAVPVQRDLSLKGADQHSPAEGNKHQCDEAAAPDGPVLSNTPTILHFVGVTPPKWNLMRLADSRLLPTARTAGPLRV